MSVGATATAGTSWFDDLFANKTQPIFQRLIAGTNPGEFLNQDVEHLFNGIISNTLELLQKAGLTDFNSLLATLGGTYGTDITAAGNRLATFLNGLSPLNGSNISTGQIGNAFVPGVGVLHDALVTAVGNLSGGSFPIQSVIEVLTGQTNSVVSNATNLINMFTRLGSLESRFSSLPVGSGGSGTGTGSGGVNPATDTDDFERVSSTSLGPTWLLTYSGPAGSIWATPNGHDASWITGGGAPSDVSFLAIRNSSVPRSTTDYQRVTTVLSAKATRFNDILFGTYNYYGANDVWLRVTDASTSLSNVTGIRIRFGGDGSLSITRFISGSPSVLKSFGPDTITPPGPGAILVGEAGSLAGGTLRYFRGIIGSAMRIEVTESGTASAVGTTARRWGHGGMAQGHTLPLPGQEKPGTLHHWNGMDQTI